MKLSTMLLPTGEFIMILSEAPEAYAEWAEEFKERTGAAAMLITTEPVVSEDALYVGVARRRDELPGVWQDLGYLDEANEFIVDYARASRTTHEELLPDPFTPGTRVEIIGPPVFNHGWAEWPGRFGVVRVPQEGRDIGVFVESEEIPDHSEDLIRWFFPPSSLQPVPATLEEAMNHFEGGN
jgi:hypothetical protein